MKLRNTIIYLIGVPAVGKYTTAKAIEHATGARVIDNQLVNAPIFTIVGYDGTDRIPVSPEAWKHIGKISRVVLNFIRDHAAEGDSFVFTNVLSNGSGDRRHFRRIERIAKHRNAVFIPVRLTCTAAAMRKRKQRPDRRERLKDIDLTNIPFWLEKFDEFTPRHPNALEIDTTDSPADETAATVIRHARACARKNA